MGDPRRDPLLDNIPTEIPVGDEGDTTHMSTQKKASKAGVQRVTARIEDIASVVQYHHKSLGIPKAAAMDFATRCDMIADFLDQRRMAGYFDPSEIAVEVPGPEVFDSNNPFMEGHFTQERFRALDEKQMSGELAANAAKHVADPKLAKLVREAAYKAAMESFTALKSAKKAEGDEAEKDAEDESAEDEDAKAEKTAMLAELYNRIKREARATVKAAPKSKVAKKAEDEEEADEEESSEEEADEADDEAKKTASLFGLYR